VFAASALLLALGAHHSNRSLVNKKMPALSRDQRESIWAYGPPRLLKLVPWPHDRFRKPHASAWGCFVRGKKPQADAWGWPAIFSDSSIPLLSKSSL
jgi:hypothetical protein